MVRVVQVSLLWTCALTTLALYCAAFEEYKENGRGLAVEGHQFDDRDPAFQGTGRDQRSIPKTLGDLQDSQTADTRLRQLGTRIGSNNGPWAYRSNWRTLDAGSKVANWQDPSFGDEAENKGFIVQDYEDYYHDLDSILDRSTYDYLNLNLDQDYDTDYELPTPLLRSQRKKNRPYGRVSDTFGPSQIGWRNTRPNSPRQWETVMSAFTPVHSHEKSVNAHQSSSSSWTLPQTHFINSPPTTPTRFNSLPRTRGGNIAPKYSVQDMGDAIYASPFTYPVNLPINDRGKKKKKRLSSNPLIRMREFLLGGYGQQNAEENKYDEPQELSNNFFHSVARERTLKDENIYPDSGGKANILLVLNKEEDAMKKPSVSKLPNGRPQMDKKSPLKPIDFDKTEQGEPLIIIDVEKVTKLVHDKPAGQPETGKMPTNNKKPVPEKTRKPLENIDYSVPVLPSRPPHIQDYYGSLGNDDVFPFSLPATGTSGNADKLQDDISGLISDPLVQSDELYDYNLKDDYDIDVFPLKTVSPTSATLHMPFRKGPLFSERPLYSSSSFRRVRTTRPKNIKIIKTGVRHTSPYKSPGPHGYPQTSSLYPPLPTTKPYSPIHNQHQLPYNQHGHGLKPPFTTLYLHHQDPYNSGPAHKHHSKGSSLIILENTYPKEENYFPQKTGIYDYEHESLSQPYGHNAYVKEFSHFLPTDDRKDILLEYGANKKEDIKGVALLIARGHEQQKTLVPYEQTQANLRRRNFDDSIDPGGDTEVELENITSTTSSQQLNLENNRELLTQDLGQHEDQISGGKRRKKTRVIASGSFSSLEEWTEDSPTVIKSGGGSIPEASE